MVTPPIMKSRGSEPAPGESSKSSQPGSHGDSRHMATPSTMAITNNAVRAEARKVCNWSDSPRPIICPVRTVTAPDRPKSPSPASRSAP